MKHKARTVEKKDNQMFRSAHANATKYQVTTVTVEQMYVCKIQEMLHIIDFASYIAVN